VGDASGRRVTTPRIRRRLRLIALGLVLLPSLALALLGRGVLEADRGAKQRSAQERQSALVGRAEELAGWLAARGELFPSPAREYFALLEAAPPPQLSQPIVLDASCAEWRLADHPESRVCEDARIVFDRPALSTNRGEPDGPREFSFSILTGRGRRSGYLYLFVSVIDDDPITSGSPLDPTDSLRLIVALPADDGVSVVARFVVAPEPGQPGALATRQVGSGWRKQVRDPDRLPWGDDSLPPFRRPFGAWRPTEEGYEVEVRLPLLTLGSRWREAELGVAVVDVDESAAGRVLETLWVTPQREGDLAAKAPDAARSERAWTDLETNLRNRRIAIFDALGRELYSSFESVEAADTGLRAAAAELLVELALDGASSVSHAEHRLAAARVDGGRNALVGFVIEQDPARAWRPQLGAILSESPQSAAILAGSLLLLFIVLAYAGRLSQRILALTGDVGADLDAQDEIGELSRRLSDLIERDRAHRDYLEQLPRILGHETLGPLSVVKMAIDDLSERDAAQRAVRSIEALIDDLREATTLEDALDQGERVELDLVALVREVAGAYRDLKGARIEFDGPDREFRTTVIERRVDQLLDKLLDNAVDFSDENPVRVRVACDRDALQIRVENTGSQLPIGPAGDGLFAPMRSGRKRSAERHLGLGLYVARLIAVQHGGGIRAWNEGRNRVVFEVTIRGAL
jgi:two-component system sensor histidine kinase ChvG